MRIEPALRRIHDRATKPRAEHAAALEDELLQSFEARPVRRRRLLWVLGAGAVALAGACVAPASYDMELGHSLTIALDVGDEPGAAQIRPDELAAHVQEHFPVEQLKVLASKAVRQTSTGTVTTLQIQIAVAGPIEMDELEASLVEAFPALCDADIDVEVLDGTVRGTVGGLLGQRALGLHLDGRSIEETRARILADLQARGLADNARIEISEEKTADGLRREVRVEVEAP